jgi:hypothetical protein
MLELNLMVQPSIKLAYRQYLLFSNYFCINRYQKFCQHIYRRYLILFKTNLLVRIYLQHHMGRMESRLAYQRHSYILQKG